MKVKQDSQFRSVWALLAATAVVIAAVETPIRNVFNAPLVSWHFWVDLIISTILMIDVVIHFLTPIKSGLKTIDSHGDIARHYLTHWGFFDIISALPLELMLAPVFSHSYAMMVVIRGTRLLRMLNYRRLGRVVSNLENQFSLNRAVMRLLLSMGGIVLLAHWVAIGWIWLGGVHDTEHPKYLMAMYWSVTTLTTVGYGDITPHSGSQIVYTMFVMFLGVGMYGYVIGNIASLIANIDRAKVEYQEKLERVNTFLRYSNVPHTLQKKVREYYDYLWNSRLGLDEKQVLRELPITLRTEVSLYLNREILQKVPLFAKSNADFIRQLVIKLKPVVYGPGDFIIRAGEIGHEMYFLSRGSVEVVSADEKTVFTTLHEGAFFGEIALLLNAPRTASIRSIGYCDLYSLDKVALDTVLQGFPDFAKEVEKEAKRRKAELER